MGYNSSSFMGIFNVAGGIVMTWNSKRELVKAAGNIASKDHPEGYNKSQLIEASKKVNGGFSTNPLKKIKTMKDVSDMGNHMSNIDGHYPVGMSGCFVVGINGGCGFSCPVFREGNCEEVGQFSLIDFEISDDFCGEVKDQYDWTEE